MDDSSAQDAAEAFEALRAEIALLRRALEGLSAERMSAPDYRPTLENLVKRQDKVAVVLKQILASPSVQMTPEMYAAAVDRAAQSCRREDRATIERAGERLGQGASQLASAMAKARTAGAQRDALIWATALTMGGTGAVMAIARMIMG